MLKPLPLVSAVVVLVLAATPVPTRAAGGPPQAAPSTNPVKPTNASLDKAKKLYNVDCAVCHADPSQSDGEVEAARTTTTRVQVEDSVPLLLLGTVGVAADDNRNTGRDRIEVEVMQRVDEVEEEPT